MPIILIELFCNSIVFSQCGDDEYYHIGGQSKRLVYNCNNTFHCHEFVRLYFESSCPKPTWYTPLNSICSWNPAQYEFPNTNYWDLNTYIKVDEQYANIARFESYGTDHSQVKDSQYPWKYISKYDKQGPVVGHNLRSSYYDIERPDGDYTFYFYLGPITGNPTITNANPVYFSVINNSSVDYEWDVIQSGSIVSLSSGSSPNTIKVTPLESGSVTLQLEAKEDIIGSQVNQSINLSVQQLPPPPPPPLLSGTYDNAGIYNQTLLTTNRVSVGGVFIRVSYPGATTYTWQKTSGNINGYFVPGPTASFNMTSGGSITLLVTAKIGSVTLTSKYITFYNYYW